MRRIESERPIGGVSLQSRVLAHSSFARWPREERGLPGPLGPCSRRSRRVCSEFFSTLLDAFMRIEKLPVLAESEPVGHARDVITSHTVETLFRDVTLNMRRKLLLIGRVGVK